MTSIRGKDFRTIAGLAVTILCITLHDIPAATAQVGDATSALNSAVRQAKRLLRGSYAWQRQARRSKKRSKEVAVEPAPLPS
ncbi:MAG: hypothetical protein ACR2OV_11225, partial [Hyphomicrobiaceae bacterium]